VPPFRGLVLFGMVVMKCRVDQPQVRGHHVGMSCVAAGNVPDHTACKRELSAKHPVHHRHFAAIEVPSFCCGKCRNRVVFASGVHQPEKRRHRPDSSLRHDIAAAASICPSKPSSFAMVR
jgi:hypothetical protein